MNHQHPNHNPNGMVWSFSPRKCFNLESPKPETPQNPRGMSNGLAAFERVLGEALSWCCKCQQKPSSHHPKPTKQYWANYPKQTKQ